MRRSLDIVLGPNDLITIAATVTEGKLRRRVTCCFDEDDGRRGEEFTTEDSEFTEQGGNGDVAGAAEFHFGKNRGIPPIKSAE
jgi:hypothetical protein